MTNMSGHHASALPVTGPSDPAALRATFDLAAIGLAQFDADGRFILVNDRLCDILGSSRERVLSRTFQEITCPDDLAHCLDLTARLAAGVIPSYCLNKRFLRPDGSDVWARISVSAVRRRDESVAFFIGAAEDISEQVQAERALATAEERLRTALDASKIGTFRFDVRRNVLEWADGFERVFGTSTHVTLDEFFAAMHPDDRAHIMAAYRRSVAEGVDFEEEFRVIWPDGSVHWLHDRGTMVRGGDGQTTHIIGAITDISNHKRMEEVLAESEAQFRTLANSIPQLAWIARGDGTRSWFNDRWCEYTGRRREDMEGLGWMRVHESAEHAAAVLNRQRQAFAAGIMWEETTRLQGRDGEYRWFLSRALPVSTTDGAVSQWFGTNTDITERLEAERRREEALEREQAARREAERAVIVRQQVLGFVAHDLRNPLQATLMAAHALLRLPLSQEQRRRRAELVERCARDMDRLIGDLLDISRIEAGTFAVRRERVAVLPIVQEVHEAFQEQARTRNIRLDVDIAAGLPDIEGDRQRVSQALGNLLNNALKFTPAGGCIALRAHSDADALELAVADTGCGIAAADLPSIFDRFWQRDRALGGAGLGLAIVKGIVESHGGTVHVESEPNRGAIVRLRFPPAKCDPRPG
jgi:PAS domain S-box-containing protein